MVKMSPRKRSTTLTASVTPGDLSTTSPIPPKELDYSPYTGVPSVSQPTVSHVKQSLIDGPTTVQSGRTTPTNKIAADSAITVVTEASTTNSLATQKDSLIVLPMTFTLLTTSPTTEGHSVSHIEVPNSLTASQSTVPASLQALVGMQIELLLPLSEENEELVNRALNPGFYHDRNKVVSPSHNYPFRVLQDFFFISQSNEVAE